MNDKQFKKWEEKYDRVRKIFCPYCGKEYKDEEYECISYYGSGDNDLAEVECSYCEKLFYVEEIVDRTYKSIKNEKELKISPPYLFVDSREK